MQTMDNDLLFEILEGISDGVYFTNIERQITFWNSGAERITGFSRDEVVGSKCSDDILRHIDDSGKILCLEGCPLQESILSGNQVSANVYVHHKLGHRIPIHVKVIPIRSSEGNISGGVEFFSEITSQHSMIEELQLLRKDVYLDSLTGMGNRHYGEMILEQLHHKFKKYGTKYGIIYLDIDDFKKFNDTYGHDTGDSVLRAISQSAMNSLRKLDALVRWGGEEFIAVIPNCDFQILKEIGERIRILVANTFLQVEKQKTIFFTVSLGASLIADDLSIDDLIKNADTKLYESKKNGKNRLTI
ncbi:MAG TPA: GGDEF domain-containing protein [Spirochaetota bacterium]|nr:GGDEF domain-containing protein [Spirochaetota bacterium]HOH37819.1 GGDEF domain-containing protein [Spirochaetota bacterium]HPY03121.1 GGDEF domain-containing protein [Spirochaetota bacterium]HQA52606.1 GGDEF domain-containing protein [Spirochaetota bacterium]